MALSYFSPSLPPLPQRADLQSAQPSDKVMGAQYHMRMVAALQKQIAMVEKKCSEVHYVLQTPAKFVLTISVRKCGLKCNLS